MNEGDLIAMQAETTVRERKDAVGHAVINSLTFISNGNL